MKLYKKKINILLKFNIEIEKSEYDLLFFTIKSHKSNIKTCGFDFLVNMFNIFVILLYLLKLALLHRLEIPFHFHLDRL